MEVQSPLGAGRAAAQIPDPRGQARATRACQEKSRPRMGPCSSHRGDTLPRWNCSLSHWRVQCAPSLVAGLSPVQEPAGSGAQGYAPGKSRCCGQAERDNLRPRGELFWEGLEIEANKTIRLQDEELASLRSTKRLLQIFQHQVPKTPEGIKEQLEYLSQADAPLSLVEFDQLLFTSVYCAYQIRSIQGLDKNLWISFFSQLVDEIIHDLCKGFCPANSTLLASWPWKEKPFYLTSLKKMYHSNPAMMKRGTE